MAVLHDREHCEDKTTQQMKKRHKIEVFKGALSRHVLCHAICYLFMKLKLFLHQLNLKNNGAAVLLKKIHVFRH